MLQRQKRWWQQRQHSRNGRNCVATKYLATKYYRGNKVYPNAIEPSLTTKPSVASAPIAMIVSVATTSYCHAWQHSSMVARNNITRNADLEMVAITYCNATYCNAYDLVAKATYCNQIEPLATHLWCCQKQRSDALALCPL